MFKLKSNRLNMSSLSMFVLSPFAIYIKEQE